MAKGDGSITPCKDKEGNPIRNRWRVEVCFGANPVTGKRERVVRRIAGTKAEARALRDELRKQYDLGIKADSTSLLFGAFANSWYEARVTSGELSQHTLQNDRAQVKTLNKHLAKIKLSDITPQMVSELYVKVRNEKSKALGCQVSSTTMHRLHATFKQIMQQAMDYDLILRNPVARVKSPRIEDPKRKSLTQEEAAALLSFLDDYEHEELLRFKSKEQRQKDWGVNEDRTSLRGVSKLSYLQAVRIGLATGMRRGEIMGLTWGDLDFEKRLLHVGRSLTMYGDVKDPKTRAGIRDIALDCTTVSHLERYASVQVDVLHALRLLPPDTWKPREDAPLLCSNVGGWCDVRNFEQWWQSWRELAGFPTLKFHELRHTQATQLLANGVDVKTVQTRMGHANAALTLNWYAHPSPENDRKAADLLETLFSPLPPHCHHQGRNGAKTKNQRPITSR